MASVTNVTQPADRPVASLGATQVKGVSNNRRALRRLLRHRMAIVGFTLLSLILLYIIVGSLLVSEARSNFNDPSNKLQPPSATYPYGTDEIGRDIFSRTIYGGQVSFFIAITAVALEIIVGVLVGLVSGYLGGVLDAVLMRVTETLLSIPQIFIALIAVKVVTDSPVLKALHIGSTFKLAGREFHITLIVLIIVIGLTSWMRVARIVRAVVLSIKEQEYITAARSIGVNKWRIITQHILPNSMGPIIVSATLGVAQAILLEAYLGFLGLGVKPPTATWGNMMEDASRHPTEWFVAFFPGLLIMLTVLGINFFGDGLRDALDPKGSNK